MVTQDLKSLLITIATLFLLAFVACTRDSSRSADTVALKVSADSASEPTVVSVPGIAGDVALPRVTRFCTLMRGDNADQVAGLFDDDTLAIFTPQSSEAVRSRAQGIKARLGGALSRAQWNSGRTISIAFLNGDASLQQRVMDAAKEWTSHANLNFVLASSLQRADIRVKFTSDDKSWSMLGTDALKNTRPDSQTIQFGWLSSQSPDAEVRQIVLHEFGHALGLIHEHQQPNAGFIPWNRSKVYAYYWYHYGWRPSEVDADVLSLYSSSVTQFSQFDPLSIMIYAIPGELTDNQLVIDWNTTLSNTDKSFIKRVYPGRQ